MWRDGSPTPPAAVAASRPPAPGTHAPGGARGISVYVEHNNMDKALRRLKRLMIEEGITKELKERTHNQKPSQLRVRGASAVAAAASSATLTLRVRAAQVLEQKARDKRLKKRELKIKLNWILRKKARGF